MPLITQNGNPSSERCPECGSIGGHHQFSCSLAPVEYLRERAMYYATKYREDFNEQLGKAYRRYAETIKRFQKNIWLWEGKFKVVKTENNALRKANQKLLLRVAELEKK